MKTLTFYITFSLLFFLTLVGAFGQQVKKIAKPDVESVSTQPNKNKDSLSKGVKIPVDSSKQISKDKKINTSDTSDSSKKVLAKKTTQNDTTDKGAKKYNAADSVILKKYKIPRILIGTISLTESSQIGNSIVPTTHPTAQKGQGFDVIGIAVNGNLILKMWNWTLKKELPADLSLSKDSAINKVITSNKSDKEKKYLYYQIDIIAKRKALDYRQYGDKTAAPPTINISGDNFRYFTLSKDSVDQVSVEETNSQNWDINFGILTTPFKIRFRKFAFTNNAGIGTAVYFQKKFKKDWSWGLVAGFSLTSVTLDAASTNVHPDGTATAPLSKNSLTTPLTTSTTRPAFTPSLSYVISYKTINFIIGVGFDFISKPTDIATSANPEAGWIYNGKPWLGIGFGISLFGNNNSGTVTKPTDGQTKGK